jgi:hypothetical protein
MDNKQQFLIKFKVTYFGNDPRRTSYTIKMLIKATSFGEAIEIANKEALAEADDINTTTESNNDYSSELISVSKNYIKVNLERKEENEI